MVLSRPTAKSTPINQDYSSYLGTLTTSYDKKNNTQFPLPTSPLPTCYCSLVP